MFLAPVCRKECRMCQRSRISRPDCRSGPTMSPRWPVGADRRSSFPEGLIPRGRCVMMGPQVAVGEAARKEPEETQGREERGDRLGACPRRGYRWR